MSASHRLEVGGQLYLLLPPIDGYTWLRFGRGLPFGMGYLNASPEPNNASMYCTLISLPSKRIVSKVMPSPGAQSKQKVCGRRPGTGRQTSGSALIRALCNDVAANCGLKILEPGRDERVGPQPSLEQTASE